MHVLNFLLLNGILFIKIEMASLTFYIFKELGSLQ